MIKKIARKPLCAMLVAGAMMICLAGCGGDEGDIASPALTIDSLSSQNENTTGTPALKVKSSDLNLTGTVEAGASVEVEVNSNEPVEVFPVGETWEYVLANADLVEGFNTISIAAEDVVGNRTSLTFLVEKDTTGPVVTIDQYITPEVTGSQKIGGKVEVSGIVEVTVDGNAAVAATVSEGLWFYDLIGLAVGPHAVSVTAFDALGNPSSLVVLDIEVGPSSLSVEPVAATTVSAIQLTGTRGSDFIAFVVDTSATVENIDLTDPSVWSADLIDMVAGNNVVTVTVDDGSTIAEAKVIATRDLAGPVVLGNSPRHGDSAVATDALIAVTFSEDMDATSVDVTGVATADFPSMTLTAADGTVVDGDVVYELLYPGDLDDFRTATFTPTSSLAADTFYTATVSSGVTDTLGNIMGTTYSWQFTTAP